MRLALLACLLLALAACDCGGYPAGAGSDDPPDSPACAGIAGEPVPLHDLATGTDVGFSFSVCGHLLARVDGADRLAGPDLAALAPLPLPDGWPSARIGFAPTGELLARSGGPGTRLLDLVTGVETALAPATSERFLPSHDLGRSILSRCTETGLVAVDRGVERTVVPGADCHRYTWSAYLAPVELAVDSGERLLVADLERGTVLDTGLPFVSRDEPTPDGEPGYRDDFGFISMDGTRVLHAQRWQVFRGDVVEWDGPDELRIVDASNGSATVYPANARESVAGFFRSGFVWTAVGDRTHLVGAGGHLELDARCREDAASGTWERVMLPCYHESGPVYWPLQLVDTRDFSTVELGDAWSVYELSVAGAAVAGCPTDAWRSGSCTAPTIRRWTEGDGLQDLPLDRPADVVWVGDDGAVLAVTAERDEALLLGAGGAVTARFPISGWMDFVSHVSTGGELVLFFAGSGGSLELVAPETGTHQRLADVAGAAAIDARGQRVAFTVPDGEGWTLRAGAVEGLP